MVKGKMLHFVAFFVHFDKLIRPHPGPLCGGGGLWVLQGWLTGSGGFTIGLVTLITWWRRSYPGWPAQFCSEQQVRFTPEADFCKIHLRQFQKFRLVISIDTFWSWLIIYFHFQCIKVICWSCKSSTIWSANFTYKVYPKEVRLQKVCWFPTCCKFKRGFTVWAVRAKSWEILKQQREILSERIKSLQKIWAYLKNWKENDI